MRTTVTDQYIETRIADVAYTILPETTVTICSITMVNGFSIRGESACVDPKNFDAALGRKYAYEDARSKIWAFEGYRLADEIAQAKRGDLNQLAAAQDKARQELLCHLQEVTGTASFEDMAASVDAVFGAPDGQMSFGGALVALKHGRKLARAGWNGKGMFVYYVPAGDYPPTTAVAKEQFGEDATVPYNAYLAIKNVNGTVSTWVPSVNDALATDWAVV